MPLDATDEKTLEVPADSEQGARTPGQRLRSLLKPGRRLWLIIGGAVLVATIAFFLFNPFGGKKEEIVTAAVARGDIEQSVLATGVLEPAKLVSVGAQASGQVKKLYVELGQVVKAGDPIADIDSRTQGNAVSNAQAALANARAQRSSSAASLTEAQLNYDRQKRLFDAGAAAKSDYDTAQSRLANARAGLAAADAQIKQASLQLSTAQTNLGYTKIVAPMDGTVVAIVTEEGQTVNANQSAPTIVKLAQLDKMTVSAEISEADVDKVAEGQTVYFTTLGDTRTRHYAKLRTIAPAPDSIESESNNAASSQAASAVYYNGLFDVDNADGKLKTGMTAQVYIVQASAGDALLIPSSALEGRGRGGTYAVKVVGKDGKPASRQVRVGINNNVSAQVLEGLKEGEKVVVAQTTAESPNAGNNQRSRNPLMIGGGRRPGGGGFQ